MDEMKIDKKKKKCEIVVFVHFIYQFIHLKW